MQSLNFSCVFKSEEIRTFKKTVLIDYLPQVTLLFETALTME